MRKILVVDDEPSNTEAVENAFRRETNYEVTSANGGGEAIRLIRERPPDLILLDWRLKGEIQGRDVLTFVKRDFPRIPVIVVTASLDIQKEIHSLGADGYIPKPCADLKEQVKAMLVPLAS